MAKVYLTTADNAFVLVVAKGTFITNAYQSGRSNVAITYGALAVAFIAQTAYSNTSLFAAHNKIAVGILASKKV